MLADWTKFYPPGAVEDLKIEADKSIASALEKSCERFSDKIALTCEGTNISFREFNRLAGRFASYLQHHVGLKKGDRIALMLPNIMQFPVAFFAAQKIGLICVNVNPLYTPREMKHLFQDSGVTTILIIDLFAHNLEEIIKETDIKTVITTGVCDQFPAWKALIVRTVMNIKKMIPKTNLNAVAFKQALALGSKRAYDPVNIEPNDTAILQYTGGTTGTPKGAILSNRNILANIAQIKHIAHGNLVPGEEQVITALPLYHIFALTVNFLTFLSMGHRIILVPKPIPIANTVKVFAKYKVSVMTGVNTLFNSLNNDKSFKLLAPHSIKFAIGGGAAIQQNVSNTFQKVAGVRIVEGYGLTEASPVTHLNPLSASPRTGSIGVPLADTNAKVVDDAGVEVATGEVGELVVAGPQVMMGYWKKHEETAQSIKNGWLWTGDMARRDKDGFFYIVDRKKEMILVSGFNVYPNEVEEVVASHPKVLEVAVIGVPDSACGEAVKAFVVPKDPSLTAEELKVFCRDLLTGYKRPRFIEFCSALPKNNIGKILRRELRDQEAKKRSGTV